MRILWALAIFIASSFSLELGKESYNLKTKQRTVKELRTFFKGSKIKISVDCIKNENITIFYNIAPHPCIEDITTLNSTVFKDPDKSYGFVCHHLVEDVSISNFPETGIYLFKIILPQSSNIVNLGMEHAYYGFLSPIDWPLLPFYSVMCAVYSVYALVWLVLCCCYWKDLLRVQFWIGAVIFMGMLEKAMFAGEYDTVRKNGFPTGGLLLGAEIVSSIKKTTFRILFIIVSLGFGFIKPRLGTAMNKVTLVGLLFFLLSVADSVERLYNFRLNKTVSIIAYFLLSITDSFIILWIFSSLMKTIRTLTMRRNTIKLALYWHFRNVLIFFVLMTVIFSIWNAYTNYSSICSSNWEDVWWRNAFWPFQFSVILLAIIILWRPSANNQMYAYSPLHDVDDGETEWSNDAIGVTKLKSSHDKKDKFNEDDDLKWVEENIPTSRIDNVLSNMIDSEDDMNQKVELSKML